MDRRSLIFLGSALLVLALAISILTPVRWYHATVSAEPVDEDETRSPVTASDLPSEYREVLRRVAAGRTVFEQGYRLGHLPPSRTGGRTGANPTILVRRTNLSGGWHVGDTFCTDRIGFRLLRVDGRYYETYGRSDGGEVAWLGPLPYVVAVSGLFLLGRGLGKPRGGGR